jgi:hypothetical protein
MIIDRKSILMGVGLGIGIAALAFAIRLDQLLKEKIIGEIIVNNAAAERHKQTMQELKKRNNGKVKPTKADPANS